MRDRPTPGPPRRGSAWASLLLACACSACLQPRPDCSGEAARLDGEPRRLHVRVRLEHAGRTQRHEVVVRAEPGRIRAVGLTPLGTVAYELVHDRDGIRVANRIGRHLSLSPRLAYDAIARAYLVAAPDGAAPSQIASERPACGYTARLVRLPDEALTRPAPGAPPPP